ncbi:hypothetical protein R3W88_001508 [Solanum pinnatisectum]|uniref:Uncharacterized protein n=1 Tax=Solanum pinnatisectum TaxID=50273 RepID=A0AAV9MIQ5_9SOLN|nr:hypothetical protein R3W88_001508 [Solanum pinnatisectum]
MELRFFRTFLKNHCVLWPDSAVKITKKAKSIVEMLAFGGIPEECRTNIYMERQVSQLWEFIENLNNAPRYLVKVDPFLIKETKIPQKTDRYLRQLIFIQKKMRFLRYLYSTEINGYFMAENVGHFCLALWVNEDEDDSKLSYLLFLIVLVELEMKKIFLCELKASKFAQSRNYQKDFHIISMVC